MNDLLGEEKDRELLVRPFDARWEAILTVYDPHEVVRGVGGTPTEAIRRCAERYEARTKARIE